MEPYRTETDETEAGEYTIELHQDDDAVNPLTDHDHDGMAFYVYSRNIGGGVEDWVTTLAEADDAGTFLHALITEWTGNRRGDDAEAIMRRYAKWKAITGSKWALFEGSGSGAVQSDWWNWYVLVDEGGDYTDPARAAKATMDDYENWAQGGYCGYVVNGPDGELIESVWGYDDEDYALSEARGYIAYDVKRRVAAAALAAEQASISASLVGSGFVGLI